MCRWYHPIRDIMSEVDQSRCCPRAHAHDPPELTLPQALCLGGSPFREQVGSAIGPSAEHYPKALANRLLVLHLVLASVIPYREGSHLYFHVPLFISKTFYRFPFETVESEPPLRKRCLAQKYQWTMRCLLCTFKISSISLFLIHCC